MKIVAIIPCYNEEPTIKKVIEDIKKYLPECEINVFDNNSTDNTYNIAKETGVNIHRVVYKGKGEVIRKAFADLNADIYIMVDGDTQYDISNIKEYVSLFINNKLDMLNIARDVVDKSVHRKGHSFGNKIITSFVNYLFGKKFNDILSGYRIFSNKFVKSFPAHSKGFEIETELTIYALQMRLAVDEIESKYFKRPEGSYSKLNTFRDGFRILFTIINILITEKSLVFFSCWGFIFLIIGLSLGIFITIEYIQTLRVDRIPTAIIVICLIILSGISFTVGIIMNSIGKSIKEIRRYRYLSIK